MQKPAMPIDAARGLFGIVGKAGLMPVICPTCQMAAMSHQETAIHRVDKVRNIPYLGSCPSRSEKTVARAPSFEEVSTITSKGQTTIPKSVRQALGVGEGDQIAFRVDKGGVTITRAAMDSDPAIAAFLSFLAKDVESHPHRLRAFPPALAKSIAKLTADVVSDPDAAIDGDVDL